MNYSQKITLTLSFLFITQIGYTQTINSINSGGWDNPNNWDCFCIPTDTDNVEIGRSDQIFLESNTEINNLTISGNAQLDVVSNFILTINGDWLNSSSNIDPFIQRTGQVIFENSINDQTITNINGETFFDLWIYKRETKLILIEDSDLTIQGSIYISSGIIYPNSNETVTFESDAVSYYNGAGYINGKVIKKGNKAFVFPIGKNDKFGAVKISESTDINNVFEAEYFDKPYLDVTSLENVSEISDNRYWILNQIHGSSHVFVSLMWNYDDFTSIKDKGDEFVVTSFHHNSWSRDGITGRTFGFFEPGEVITVKSTKTLSDIKKKPISLGFLYTDIHSFRTDIIASGVEITWTTKSENNVLKFEIYRSVSGSQFKKIGEIEGNRFSSEERQYALHDNDPKIGETTYQLHEQTYSLTSQILTTTKMEYVSVVLSADKINYEGDPVIFPNSGNGNDLKIKLARELNADKIEIIFYTSFGRIALSQTIEAQQQRNIYKIEGSDTLRPGIYHVMIKQRSKLHFIKVIVL